MPQQRRLGSCSPIRATRPAVRLAAFVSGLSLVLAACGSGGGGGDDAAAGKGCDKAPTFPNRPIELVVPWAAGGGTDSVARFLASQLRKKLGTQVNVVNRTAGSGVVGHSAIANGRSDGSVIGLITVELTMMHWQGLTEIDYQDVTPIGQVNADAAGITVSADAPWNSAEDLIDAAEKDPGKLTASGTGRGGIWDVALKGMLIEAGVDPNAVRFVPSEGAAPALQELVAGGIDVSTSSLVENKTMIDAKKVKPIGVMAPERDSKYPDVHTLEEDGIDYEMSAWRGLAGPKGMDPKIAAELSCHLEEVVDGKPYKDFMNKAGFGIVWRNAKAFEKFMAAQDKSKGAIMKKAGLTS
ncbi:MAG: tripartite tricarboxylate transporter substrate binding protein [Streptosporangiales bacterium]|nr:tripartite tricarboxylate transporter substrate binding protein [Streptosporangiales bacterium]